MSRLQCGLSAILVLLLCYTNTSFAQEIKIGVINEKIILEGTVVEKETQLPIPGAHVYLNKTTVVSATDKEGRFRIETGLKGTFEFVVSFVGFKRQVFPLKLEQNGYKKYEFEIELEEKLYQPGEITVTGSNKRWRRNFKAFRDNFIGQKDFADQTSIQNYTDLEFDDKNRSEFTAKSATPLEIINHALGYKIIMELEEFNWDLRRGNGHYLVYERYAELEPKDEAEKTIWERNRQIAFRGSARHFFQSLFEKNSFEEGFTYRLPTSLREISGTDFVYLKAAGEIPDTDHYRFYHLRRLIKVNVRDVQKPSMLDTNDRGEIIGVDKYGNLYDPLSVRISGYWAHNRIGEQLPFDYIYKPKRKTNSDTVENE